MKNVTGPISENILKLRELTKELTKAEADEYKDIVIQLKTIVDNGQGVIESADCTQSKIKCYESMCMSITALLKNINLE
jgi:hypothetical protein